ncbi:hypothetical protein [Endozoicomonas euniceicola]|uniref:Uncharacterized protein n=1 Tax=Endozoicomonas euniceicola TaxID=1234143 RepID=A0ABY6GXI2_9GAMM|nr:hypothetical protein [Endozoicomonas euniceicola]UYM17493.1 hypothetical protein NX720_06120 [Endozoicomonas euniceicola]
MKLLFSGVLFWLLIAFSHLVLANACDEIIITIDGSPVLLIKPVSQGIIVRRAQPGDLDSEQQASGSCVATISNELSRNPETELTINGLGGFSMTSLYNFIEAMGDRTVCITGESRLIQYRVADSRDRTGCYRNAWTEVGRTDIGDWYQLFSDSESFVRGADTLVESPEQFFQNVHSLVSSGNSGEFSVNPLSLFFNREWLQQFTQFLQGGSLSNGYYHLDLRALYFRTDWTVYLTEPGIAYRVMQLGRALYLNIVNTSAQTLRVVNPGDGNAQPLASNAVQETPI